MRMKRDYMRFTKQGDIYSIYIKEGDEWVCVSESKILGDFDVILPVEKEKEMDKEPHVIEPEDQCWNCQHFMKPIELYSGIHTNAICRVSPCSPFYKYTPAIEFIEQKEMTL